MSDHKVTMKEIKHIDKEINITREGKNVMELKSDSRVSWYRRNGNGYQRI